MVLCSLMVFRPTKCIYIYELLDKTYLYRYQFYNIPITADADNICVRAILHVKVHSERLVFSPVASFDV